MDEACAAERHAAKLAPDVEAIRREAEGDCTR
jgi:hypothetical protein